MTAAESIAAYRASMTEAQFQRRVIDLAIRYRWRVYHARPAIMRSGSWATATEGHVGWPDLACARKGRLLLVELKTDKGRLSDDQQAWIDALGGLTEGAGIGEFEVHVWRPRDWDEIVGVLR